ncbi:MAG TPA: DUF1800 domain-containing protein [Puia sp.]|jgi:uncharacterized protein (DUF1800 family)|nr:DUF1800 domain-containing protein [Puia sp.]
MKTVIKLLGFVLVLLGGHLLLSSFLTEAPLHALNGAGLSLQALNGTRLPPAFRLPYRQAGLTERQAAAHLLSRFTYGAMPGQVDAVVQQGLENWFLQQLAANVPDDSLERCLSQYDALQLTNEQVVGIYPRAGQVTRMAIKDGVVNKDSVKTDRKEYREIIRSYMQEKGYKPEQELFRQFFCQKVLRAAYSPDQLQEVMTDFWFNHFNVSITKNDCAEFIPAYERDVIRPGALGRFSDLLLKTAKSPAMLYYLDNFSSSSPLPGGQGIAGGMPLLAGKSISDSAAMAGIAGGDSVIAAQIQQFRKNRGLNENYAREVMELHTLGVDGGYTQQDVTQAARVLTGWTVYPMNDNGKGLINRFSGDQLARRGFVHEGDFLFNANRHDKGEKTVLGHVFPAGGGYDEGVELLELLAHHPSTARFISRKIAVRFVSDDPPQTLIDKMAKTFLEKDGDIRQVLITMVTAPEFWSPAAIREKTKSPFELAIGAVRSLHATIEQPYPLYNWVSKMGEKKYYYQAPTGFPDKGSYWINTGSLLNRMNFGLALAAGKVPGVRIDLAALNNGHEPESAQAALLIYGGLFLPERNLEATVQRLTPLLTAPDLERKVEQASGDAGDAAMAGQAGSGGNPMLAQVVGIIIGSPEYQRR